MLIQNNNYFIHPIIYINLFKSVKQISTLFIFKIKFHTTTFFFALSLRRKNKEEVNKQTTVPKLTNSIFLIL